MRLIDADELIDFLVRVTVIDGIAFETGFKQILRDIKNAPTVETGWNNMDTKPSREDYYLIEITVTRGGANRKVYKVRKFIQEERKFRMEKDFYDDKYSLITGWKEIDRRK